MEEWNPYTNLARCYFSNSTPKLHHVWGIKLPCAPCFPSGRHQLQNLHSKKNPIFRSFQKTQFCILHPPFPHRRHDRQAIARRPDYQTRHAKRRRTGLHLPRAPSHRVSLAAVSAAAEYDVRGRPVARGLEGSLRRKWKVGESYGGPYRGEYGSGRLEGDGGR